MEEIWKDIKGYENLYQVSNKGRVKSLNYKRSGKTKILKPKNNKGYLQLNLYKNGERNMYLVHRLVAENFIPNPNNQTEINHLDFNRKNNCVNNLEFCDRKYNIQYSKGVKIKCLDLETNETVYYPSINNAAFITNTSEAAIWYSIYKSKSPYKKRYIFSLV